MIRITLLALVGALVFTSGSVAFAQQRPETSDARAAKVAVPNVVGMRMDRATRTLHQRGLRVNEECSGLFGCIVKSRWWVCSQSVRPGARVTAFRVVVIYAEREGEC
jgi:hypothetical protein